MATNREVVNLEAAYTRVIAANERLTEQLAGLRDDETLSCALGSAWQSAFPEQRKAIEHLCLSYGLTMAID